MDSYGLSSTWSRNIQFVTGYVYEITSEPSTRVYNSILSILMVIYKSRGDEQATINQSLTSKLVPHPQLLEALGLFTIVNWLPINSVV